MKLFKLIFLVLTGSFTFMSAASQNALINILAQNSGTVRKGETVFLEVTIINTNAISDIGAYKIKAQISVPSEIAGIDTSGNVLPTGWTITGNTGSTIFLSNGTDVIPRNSARTILIAVHGKKTGGPSTIIGQLSFSDGNPPGTALGSLPGDNPADNSSTTTIKVLR